MSRFQDYLLDSKKNIDDLVADAGKYPNRYGSEFMPMLPGAAGEASTADFTHSGLIWRHRIEKLINAYWPFTHRAFFITLVWFRGICAEFLAETQPYAQHPDLLEMALFEWALCAAFDATDVAPGQPQ